jgi:hypothetical protein
MSCAAGSLALEANDCLTRVDRHKKDFLIIRTIPFVFGIVNDVF